MESRIKKSGGVENHKRKSLDLKSLYNSRVSDVGRSKKQVSEENHKEVVKKRKRKNGKEVSLSCIESDAKKSKECINGAEPDHDFIRESSDGSKLFHGISFALEKNGKTINIPKRPRGLVGRKRLKSGKVSQSLNISRSEDHVETSETDTNKVIDPDDQLVKFDSGHTRSSDTQLKQKLKIQSVGTVSSSSSKLKHKKATEEVKKSRHDRPNLVNIVENEDTQEVNNGDMRSKIWRRIRRKQKDLVVGGDGGKTLKKKSKPSNANSESDSHFVPFVDDEDEENLEQNAARMLSSRFDPNCTVFNSTNNGFASPDSLAQDSFGTMESASTEDKSRALRPRSGDKSKGIPRKRRHFYDVIPDDLDSCWFLNRKIKVFWPLDESWYYGIVKDYHPECKLYHIKYDDRDEEWVDLHEEKFKLLLLPSEVPGRTKTKISGNKDIRYGKSIPSSDDDGRIKSHPDSETIASWLTRSCQHIKSLPKFLEKRKFSLARLALGDRSSPEETDQSKGKLAESKISLDEPEGKSASVDKLLDLGSFDRSPILQHVESSLPCEKNDSSNKFSCAKRAKSDPKCDSASEDKMRVDGKLDQTLVTTSSSSRNVSNIVYVRRRYGGQFKTFSSLFAPVKLHDSSEESVAVDPDTGSPVTVGLNNRKENDSHYVCLESDERLCLIESKSELRLHVPTASQEINVQVCLRLSPFLEYFHGGWNFLLLHKLLILHDGSVVATSPVVILEMLFMKSNLGLRFLLFEGCLMQALTIVFLILTEFSHSDIQSNVQLPMTSIRIKLSSVRDLCKKRALSFYIFSRLQSWKWLYLESKLIQYCCLVNQIPATECFYCNIKDSEHGDPQNCEHQAGSELFSSEVGKYTLSKPRLIDDSRDITTEEKTQTVETETPFQSLSGCEHDLETECVLASNVIEKVHYSKGFQKKNLDGTDSVGIFEVFKENMPEVTAESHLSEFNQGMNEPCLVSSSLPAAITSPSSNPKFDSRISDNAVDIPLFDQVGIPFNGRRVMSNQTSDVYCSIIDDFDRSSNPTYSTRSWKQGRTSSVSSPPEDYSRVLPDGKTNFMRNGFSNGPKKPRTQVQYTLPFAGYELNAKQKMENHRAPHCKRIRRASQRRMPDSYKNNPKNLELLACDANILVTNGDKGWRESGAHVFLEVADHNEWRLVIKLFGITRYSYKVKHILQPGSTNRFSHAMMWRGGNDWVLEFPDRSQWTLFKEMHEECYNRNIRAASVKHIPIPGVWLVDERNENGTDIPFVRNPVKYFRQVQTDVDMALDPSRVLYDLDSEDEQWLIANRTCSEKHISDENMEKIIDTFEKVSYVKHRDNFTDTEIEELVTGIGSLATTKAIYNYWQQKREKNGMHLTRHLQPPLWDRYQQQLKGWELNVSRGNSSFSVSPSEKPPMFAFCLKPRGLDVPNKGSKQRSHRKFSVSGHHHTTSGDHDSHFAFGRRSNGHDFGNENLIYANTVHESSDASPSLQASMRVLPPRDTCFSLITNVSEWNCYPKVFKYKPTKLGSHSPYNNQQMIPNTHRTIANRNGIPQWNMDFPELPSHRFNYFEGPHRQVVEHSGGYDLQEFRLRDATRAAQHALKMAKIKREKAQRLFSNAEFAIHKAVVALMTAEAIKSAVERSDGSN